MTNHVGRINRPNSAAGGWTPAKRLGAALLEAIIAIAVVTISGIAAVTVASDSVRAVQRARDAEAALREASRFFEAVALWPREDLDRRLGDRHQGPWLLRIGRVAPELYTVSLRDTLDGSVLLSTSLFRRGGTDAIE